MAALETNFSSFIANHTLSSTETLTVVAPYTGEAIGTVAKANETDIEQALLTANDLFTDRSNWLSAPERIAILEKAVAIMESQADELALASALEGGKPLIDS